MNVPGLGEIDLRRINQAIRDLATGGTNAFGAGAVTLTVGATETEVQDRSAAPGSLPMLCLTSAAAAAAQPFLHEARAGSFVLGHQPAGPGATLRYELRRP
ncbi:hypothetical protein PUR29_14120 [Methylobacterium ajmalii]|uniref:Uncharacterized protein n=1 Tax=Methylobacterium ajmalii TaxID=2738439 RepID=A0ABU9ZTQ9_9HYPH